MTHNGWNNWETWCVNLWLTSDEGTQSYLEELAQRAAAEYPNDKTDASYYLAAWIKDWVDDLVPQQLTEPSLWTDLVQGALREVDWREMADALLESVAS